MTGTGVKRRPSFAGNCSRRLIVFTDLDGTLLDHDDYAWAGAARTLELLAERGVPLIFVSSKTRSEITHLQSCMGITDQPFVVENGGGVFFPSSWRHGLDGSAVAAENGGAVCLGIPYRRIRNLFETLRRRYPVTGFGDMTVEDVIAHTGLDRAAALRAMAREFSEPFLFDGDLDELLSEVRPHGMTITTGGRFHHLLAAGQDKGRAVRLVAECFARLEGAIVTVGLGDAANDLPLLRAVDVPVVVPRPDGSRLHCPDLAPLVAPAAGSSGWGVMVERLLTDAAFLDREFGRRAGGQ